MKMIILCMIALLLLVIRPYIYIKYEKYLSTCNHVIHERQVAKVMRWGIVIVERGVRGISPD